MLIKDFFARKNMAKIKQVNTIFIEVDMSKIEFEIDSDMDKTPIFKQTIDLKRFMDEKRI